MHVNGFIYDLSLKYRPKTLHARSNQIKTNRKKERNRELEERELLGLCGPSVLC